MYVEEKREAEAPVVESPERQVILRAIEILSQPGVWSCESPDTGAGRHCLSTAIQLAAVSISPAEGRFGALSDSVHFLVAWQVPDKNIIHWNDAPGRTVDEVLGVLRKTAELL